MTDTPQNLTEDQPAVQPVRPTRSQAFVENIRRLKQTDIGKLAALRRNAGHTLTEARGTNWFYSTLDRFSISRHEEEVFYLVATLLAGDKAAMHGQTHFSGDLGVSMRMLRNLNPSSDAAERRFGLLLDSDFGPDGGGEMAFRLRQTIRLLMSKGIPVDWSQLLDDLRWWSNETRSIRKKWARSFYAAPEIIMTEEPVTESKSS